MEFAGGARQGHRGTVISLKMITELHRGHVRLQVGDKSITIEGEAYLKGHGSPDFVAYRSTIKKWDLPDGHPLSSEEIARVEDLLKREFAKKAMLLEIE